MEFDWNGLGGFILKVGVPTILALSVPALIWKYMDMRSKGGTLWGKRKQNGPN